MLTDSETEQGEAGNEGKSKKNTRRDYFRIKDGKYVPVKKKKK